MASKSKLIEELLQDLKFPSSLLQILDDGGIDIFSLITVSEHQFNQSLEELDSQLDNEDISSKSSFLFGLIHSWRNRNKSAIRSLVNSCIFTSQTETSETTLLREITGSDSTNESCQREARPLVPLAVHPLITSEEKASSSTQGSGAAVIKNLSQTLSVASGATTCVPEADDIINDLTVALPAASVEETATQTSSKQHCQVVICAAVEDSQQSSLSASSSVDESFVHGEVITHASTSAFCEGLPRPLPLASAPAETQVTRSSCNTFDCTTLLDLLKQSEGGEDIITNARDGELPKPKQLELAGIIAKYHLIHREKLRAEDLQTYTLAVCTLFKSERQENYYIARGGDRKNHGGKIADKIGNLKKKKRKSDAPEKQHAKRSIPSDETVDHHEESSIQAYEWLVLNTEPWTTVIDKWPLSISKRKPFLLAHSVVPKVLRLFPHYKNQYGYQLIDTDFKHLFGGSSNEILGLEEIRPGITAFIAKKAVDPSAENILKLLIESDTTEDTKHCALLLGLSTVLPPISAGTHFKPTICVSQEDTLIFAESEIDASSKVQHMYQTYIDRKLPVVPKLVVLGKDVNNISGRFFVYFEDFHYELPTAAREIDVILKTTAVFGLPYSPALPPAIRKPATRSPATRKPCSKRPDCSFIKFPGYLIQTTE